MTQPVGLLLSKAVDAQEGARIDALARDAGVALRRHTSLDGPNADGGIHAAFFSRELYEGSSLRTPGALSNHFFGMVDACPDLRWLHVCSAGLDLPQYASTLTRGVRVTGSRGATAMPIAQTVLAAILAQSRGFGHWLPAQARREWSPLTRAERPRDIAGQRVVVVGAGAIGSEIGRLLRAVGFHVTAVRKSAAAAAQFDETVSFDRLDSVLPACDWLVLAAPLTSETAGMLDASRLARLRSDASLVNVARGELVDETALISALQTGRLKGAYLDAFLQEPLPVKSPLWTLPNVWISPHNSSASQGHEQRVIECFVAELQDWLAQTAATSRAATPDRGSPVPSSRAAVR